MKKAELYLGLPRYRCHKKVRAAEIKSVEPGRIDGKGPGATIYLNLPIRSWVCVGEEFMHKHDPRPGGYFVVYDDGYESFSPAKAFEEGYTRCSQK